jgi:hypothetical protein
LFPSGSTGARWRVTYKRFDTAVEAVALSVPARALADHDDRGVDRGLVVLRAASIRGYDENDREWNVHTAALHGSSHYDLPGILAWFTAHIGVHHVHHPCSRIPYYRLPQVLRDHPKLRGVGRLTLLQSFRCVRLVLWDETRRRLVSFRDGCPSRFCVGYADGASEAGAREVNQPQLLDGVAWPRSLF